MTQSVQAVIRRLKRRELPSPDLRSKKWRGHRRTSPQPYKDGVAVAESAVKEYAKDLAKIK